MTKTLLVGLDAACWEYLDPLLHAGQMPTLHMLMENGISGTLPSTIPPWTPAAWSSIVTGKNPGKHGVFDMLWRSPGGYEFKPVNAEIRKGVPFWHYLNQQGIRVGLVNVPFSFPLDQVDGFAVGGFGTPDSASNITYPEDILSWIEREFGDYEPTVAAEFLKTAAPEQIFNKERDHQARQVQIAAALCQQYEVDVLVINLMFTDHANHKMPHIEQVYEAYRHSDVDLGNLISAFQPDNVMLISDHGSSRLKGDFRLDLWLRDQGYLVPYEQKPRERSAALNWLLSQWLQNYHGWSGLGETIVRTLLRESLFRLPSQVRERFWNKIEAIFAFAREQVLWSSRLDFTQTKLFPGSAYSGLLYLNMVGREATGVVHSETRETLNKEITEKLMKILDPLTGNPLFSRVYTSDELYSGPDVAERAPDLILDAYDSGWNIRTTPYTSLPILRQQHERYFVELGGRDYGWHSRDGIFVFSGAAFNKGVASDRGRLVDVPSTLLHLYNVPIPEDYDGEVLLPLLASTLREQPVRYQAGSTDELDYDSNTYSTEDEQKVLDHLRALGYLD